MDTTRWVIRRKLTRGSSRGVFLWADDANAPADFRWVPNPWNASHFRTRGNAQYILDLVREGWTDTNSFAYDIIEVALVKNADLFSD